MLTDQSQFAEPFHEDPQTISALAENALAELFNQMRAGLISPLEAKECADALEETRAVAGDSWSDRYPLLPGEPDPYKDIL